MIFQFLVFMNWGAEALPSTPLQLRLWTYHLPLDPEDMRGTTTLPLQGTLGARSFLVRTRNFFNTTPLVGIP